MKRIDALKVIEDTIVQHEGYWPWDLSKKILEALEDEGMVPRPPSIIIPAGTDVQLVNDIISSFYWEPEENT